jgi:hypothetical protein
MTIDQEIDHAVAQADRLFDDQLRQATTRLLTFGGDEATVDVDVLDDALDAARRAWAIERATIPPVIRRALEAKR